ncbi:unnamed protein product [Eruca vesicaria subsp. sativa]|uniref:Uncharacterized protein n=1 Tax=Eruca vesicaria subsp. sativa TaxID=29727 RepID=A0ABC8L450_ERUVS|nr:unnamed protein product [Eruca vesicaria subsp. sativa]
MQYCSSCLKMMVTARPPSQSRPPPDPPPNRHHLTESPVDPPEPPDPPDASVSHVLLRILVTSSSSSPQATQILDLSRVSTKLSGGGAALKFIVETIFVYWCSSPVVYRSYLFQLVNGSSLNSYSSLPFLHPLIDFQVHFSSSLSVYPSSVEWDSRLDGWVTLKLLGCALICDVLLDSVSFGYIFEPGNGFFVALWELHTVVYSLVSQVVLVGFSFMEHVSLLYFPLVYGGYIAGNSYSKVTNAVSFVMIKGSLNQCFVALDCKAKILIDNSALVANSIPGIRSLNVFSDSEGIISFSSNLVIEFRGLLNDSVCLNVCMLLSFVFQFMFSVLHLLQQILACMAQLCIDVNNSSLDGVW